MTKLAPLPEAGATSVIFFGTPEVAVRHLESLVSFGCNVVLVVTRPDVRRGRGSEESPSPVKIAAQKLNIDVTHSLDDVLSVAKLDVKTIGVVVAYGEVLPSAVLEKVPMINVHFSLLPRWRGAAPVERAILAGDAKTGVCIMRVGEKLDEGEVYARREILINDLDTTDSLREKLNDLSVDLVRDAVLNGCGTGVAQAGEVLYAKKIRSSDLQIDWDTSATQILRQVRVGGAFSFVSGKRLKILQAKIVGLDSTGKRPGQICVVTKTECVIATADSGLSLIELQPEGKAVMQVEGWLNGARLNADSVFGS